MPATDALAPSLSPKAKEIVKSYGGWTNTVHSFGGKAYDMDDIEETRQIVESFAADEIREAEGNKK